MILNIGSCYWSCYGVLVCDNVEKWGGIVGFGKWFIDVFGSNFDVEEWYLFVVCEGELFLVKDLDIFNGFFILGSLCFVNDNIKWINDLKIFIFFLELNFLKVCVVGVCFGY